MLLNDPRQCNQITNGVRYVPSNNGDARYTEVNTAAKGCFSLTDIEEDRRRSAHT